MHLRDYLREKSQSQAAFGQRMRPPISAAKVNHWLEGRRRVSLAEGLQVELLCEGLVTLPELAEMYQSRTDSSQSHSRAGNDEQGCEAVHVGNVAGVDASRAAYQTAGEKV